jgi:hypothetical protein
MKSQYVVRMGAGLASGVALTVFAPVVAAVMVGVAAVGLGLYWLGTCRHSGPLGLLPPTTADDGSRVPARWYCDACGKAWPAGLESDHAPVVRFTGYDESKLPAAAKRAAAFEKQRTVLAAKRAGLAAGARAVETAPPAAAPANVTPISNRRAG